MCYHFGGFFPSHMKFLHLFLLPFTISLWCKCLLLLDSITMLLFPFSFFTSRSWQLYWYIVVYHTEFILDKDLSIVPLLDDHLWDSLDSLAFLLKISGLTTRSKCEHKYIGAFGLETFIPLRKISHWKMESYAFSFVHIYNVCINAWLI